jgi:hypothetical protein
MVLNTFFQQKNAHGITSSTQNVANNYKVFGMLFNFMQAKCKICNHR